MPRPSSFKKVQNLTIILISHISIVVAILALVIYPYFPDTVKLTLENFKAAVTNLVVRVHNSVHRTTSIYNPTHSTRVRKLQKEEDSPSFLTSLMESLNMCKKAVVGENIEDAENKGIGEYTFSIFDLHISSVGTEI